MEIFAIIREKVYDLATIDIATNVALLSVSRHHHTLLVPPSAIISSYGDVSPLSIKWYRCFMLTAGETTLADEALVHPIARPRKNILDKSTVSDKGAVSDCLKLCQYLTIARPNHPLTVFPQSSEPQVDSLRQQPLCSVVVATPDFVAVPVSLSQ